jgi:Flp pilus assembly pilin Flp
MPGQKRLESLMEKSREQDGQALVEYALIVMFVALVCVAALSVLGVSIQGIFNGFSGSI